MNCFYAWQAKEFSFLIAAATRFGLCTAAASIYIYIYISSHWHRQWKINHRPLNGPFSRGLSGPILRDIAILSLRYPISRDTFQGRSGTPPKWCDALPLVLHFTQTHLCDDPFCNVSRDNCAIPHNPVLLFLGLFENTKENLKNTKDFSHLYEPLKALENKQKTPKKTKEFRSKKNTKETKTSRKRRTGKKTSTKTFCDTIARSIARYAKYRCWASKRGAVFQHAG